MDAGGKEGTCAEVKGDLREFVAQLILTICLICY